MSDHGPSKGMDWMYKGPSALVDREDYLLGRKVDKSFQLLEAQERGGDGFSYADEVEKDLTPASIFSARSNGAAGPVDIVRKIKEDPLYQIEKKEQETLKQLLQNPIKLKQLQKLAEEKQRAAKSKKHKKKHKRRRSSSSSSDDSGRLKKLDQSAIDKLLAAKINALKKKSSKKRNSSSSSSSSSSSDEKRHLARSRQSSYHPDRSTSQKTSSRDVRSYGRDRREHRDRERSRDRDRPHDDRFRSPPRRDRTDGVRRRSRSRSPARYRSIVTSSSSVYKQQEKRKPLSEEEMERRRREMMENAKVRDEDRKRNVERWREEQRQEEEEQAKQHDSEFIRKHLLTAAEDGTVEKRIKSNSYNIQKSSSAMSQNFARR